MPKEPFECFKNRKMEEGKVYYSFTLEELDNLIEDVIDKTIIKERSGGPFVEVSLDDL